MARKKQDDIIISNETVLEKSMEEIVHDSAMLCAECFIKGKPVNRKRRVSGSADFNREDTFEKRVVIDG